MLKGTFFNTKNFERQDKQAMIGITLNPLHKIYEGHFPGDPVTPGVCQIQMVKEVIREIIGQDLFLQEAKSIKFLNILTPDCENLNLEMEWDENDSVVDVTARLSSGDQIFLKFSGRFLIR